MTRREFLLLSAAALAAPGLAFAEEWAGQPMIPERGNLLPLPGGRLHFEAGGYGTRTVIFIHDQFTDAAVWEDIWPILGREYRTVRYDRRGYGFTPPSTEAYVPSQDLAELMNHLSIPSAVLVAGSDGANIALEFALAYPGRVEQLLLVSPIISGAPMSPAYQAWVDANNAPLATGDAASAASNWAGDRYIVSGPNRSARSRLRQIYAACPNDLGARDIRAVVASTLLPRLGGVQAQTLILSGARDMPEVVTLSQSLQRAIPGARRDPVQGSGHLIYLDEPEIFAAAALAYIRTFGATTG